LPRVSPADGRREPARPICRSALADREAHALFKYLNDTDLVDRSIRVFLSAIVALPCLCVAAVLAFDWADYGEDSTCGNFVRRKNWSGPCSDIMWHRTFAVIGLVLFSIVLVLVAWRWRGQNTVTQQSA
jgi:hypothetical protein